MVFSKLVWLLFISQLGQNASQKGSERKFVYNPGPNRGCGELGRSINVYNYQCKGSKLGVLGDVSADNSVQADEKPPTTVVRPVIYTPNRPILNFLLPVRRFRPIAYADLSRPINRPFRYQNQGSSVVNLSGSGVGSPTRIQYVRPPNAYSPQAAYSPQSPQISSSNTDNVYNPFRPESSTNIKPTPPSSNRPQSVPVPDNVYNPQQTSSSIDNVYNPFRPENSQISNAQTPSPLTVEYFGTPIPTYTPTEGTTTNRPNYAVPAYPINLPTNRPFSPSSISNSYNTNTFNRPGLSQASAGISSVGNRPGFSQISSSAGINSIGNRPGSGFTQVTGINSIGDRPQVTGNRPGSDNFNKPTNDHRPVIEDYEDDNDPPAYVSFSYSNLSS